METQRAKRYNDGKIDYTLLPQDALDEEALVWGLGELKYGRHNWEKLWGPDTVNVVLASMLRHVAAIRKGETHDKESGKQHAAHIRCNAAMLIRHFNREGTHDTVHILADNKTDGLGTLSIL